MTRTTTVWFVAALALAGCSSSDESGGAGTGGDLFGNAGGTDDGVPGTIGGGSGTSGTGSAGSDAMDGSGAAAGSGGGGNGTAAGTNPVVPQGTIVPQFPGAGTSGAGVPLAGGMVCDVVQDAPIDVPEDMVVCFYGPDDPTNPAATIEQVLECVDGTNAVHLRLTFSPEFVDNTYGINSIGWEMTKKGLHTFKDLVGSDHAEIIATDGNGEIALHFRLDYVSEDASAPSGYATQGVTGGEGDVIVGDAASFLDAASSIDRNLNERGLSTYTTDSPATDANYTPNPDAPEWDYRVVYETWIDADAFGDAGFGGAKVEYVHASPAKQKENTIVVEPGECPPDWGCKDPDGCYVYPPDEDEPPPGDDACADAPDSTECGGGTGDPPPPPDEAYCLEHPEEPECNVE